MSEPESGPESKDSLDTDSSEDSFDYSGTDEEKESPRVAILHAAEDEEFVRRLVGELIDLDAGGYYSLPETAIVTGAPGVVSRAQLTSTLTLGSVKLVVPVISRHLLADQSSLTVGLETAVRNNKPRYAIWLDQNVDDFREFGTLVSRQYPTLEAPARRVQRHRVEEKMPGSIFSIYRWMEGIAWGVRDALCRQTGELRFPCWWALINTRVFLPDNMNLPAVLTRLEQENQLSPADVRSIKAKPTPVSRARRLVDMLQYGRRRQEPYDWLVRVLREEGQDFLAEEMEERERFWERHYGIGKQQAAQPGQQIAQTEHFTQQESQVTVMKHLRHPRAHADDVTTPLEVKGVFLGQTEAGKTSLLNCMIKGQGHVETETDRTIGVDVISFHDTKNNVRYAMYDFGGHQIYHYTHRFFLTRQALHILNVDLPAYKSEEFQERVGTWLTSVTSHVFNPTILVVGTKVDMFPPDKAEEMIAAACSSIQRDTQGAESKLQTKLKEEIQFCQKAVDAVDSRSDMSGPFYGLTRDDILAKKESLEKLLDGRPKGLLNVQVIPVSSKTFQGIGALCDKMAEMVKDERLFPAARQEMPTSWTKLSENIQATGRTHRQVRECQDVGAAAGMKESDVLNALSYLHVTGQILFYNHIRGMEDLVFPDPTIILTLFKQIFRHDLPAYLDSIAESLSEHTRAQFAEDRASFLKTGRASDSFMKNLLGDSIVTFNSLLPLMKHFGLCYSGSVIFPTELPAAQPDEVAHCWPEVVPSGGEEISLTIEYSQEPPLGLPETMVSRILSMEQTTRRLLTKDTVVVHVGENSEDVMYRHSATREEIRIRGEPEKAWRRAQTVVREIEACWDEFPALYSSNSVGSGETAKSLPIEAVRRHVPGDLMRLSRGSWEGPLPVTRTPADVIGKYFIDNRLYQVSRAVCWEWTRLGQELGLNRSVLDNIGGEYRLTDKTGTQKAFQMLKAWRTKTPHGPLHYLPQLEETLQNIGKPDLAKDVQGVYIEYRDALPLQEVSPEMTGDTDWSLRLPGEGKYLCRRTDLGVVTPYPLHVTYRSANWSDNWQQDQGWMAVGPLFSIQCEDVEGPVDILLPHVLHLDGDTVLNPDDIAIVHVAGETEELLTVSDISPTHLTTRFRKGSKFGPVVRKILGMDLRRNGLCVVFAPPNYPSVFQLHVYIISNVVLMVEYLQALEGRLGYSSWDPEQCVLKLGEEYRLEVTARNGAGVDVETRPEEGLEFDDTFETGQYYKKFRVEVDARKYSRAQRSKLRFDLHLKNADETVCRFTPAKDFEQISSEAGPSGTSLRGKRKIKRKGDVEEPSADDLYLRISQNLKDEQVRDLRNYLGSKELLPARDLQHMDPHQMCTKLEQSGKLWEGNPTLLERLMRKVGREDFAVGAKRIAEKELGVYIVVDSRVVEGGSVEEDSRVVEGGSVEEDSPVVEDSRVVEIRVVEDSRVVEYGSVEEDSHVVEGGCVEDSHVVEDSRVVEETEDCARPPAVDSYLIVAYEDDWAVGRVKEMEIDTSPCPVATEENLRGLLGDDQRRALTKLCEVIGALTYPVVCPDKIFGIQSAVDESLVLISEVFMTALFGMLAAHFLPADIMLCSIIEAKSVINSLLTPIEKVEMCRNNPAIPLSSPASPAQQPAQAAQPARPSSPASSPASPVQQQSHPRPPTTSSPKRKGIPNFDLSLSSDEVWMGGWVSATKTMMWDACSQPVSPPQEPASSSKPCSKGPERKRKKTTEKKTRKTRLGRICADTSVDTKKQCRKALQIEVQGMEQEKERASHEEEEERRTHEEDRRRQEEVRMTHDEETRRQEEVWRRREEEAEEQSFTDSACEEQPEVVVYHKAAVPDRNQQYVIHLRTQWWEGEAPRRSHPAKTTHFSEAWCPGHALYLFPLQRPTEAVDLCSIGEVMALLKDINPNKASGPDYLPTWTLKGYAEDFAPVITHLFNASYGAKLLERCILKRLLPSITPVITNQYAYLKGSSTVIAVIRMIHIWLSALDSRDQTCVQTLFADMSKAFDRVSHAILLQRVNDVVPSPRMVAWLQNYLHGRTQRVAANGEFSGWRQLTSGVPQGGVLSPYLFLLFMSSREVVHSDTIDVGYADDVSLSRSVSLKNAGSDTTMTEEASQLDTWADRNEMLLNGKKSQAMLICFSRNIPVLPPLSLGGEPVPVTNVAKGLGFIFDDKLSWREHVRSTVSKASSRLHYLRLLTKQGMSVEDLIQVYLSLIRPVLEYGHVLLVGCSEDLAASMERVQRRALRIISRGGRRSVPDLPSLKERREAAAVTLFKAMLRPDHPLHDLAPVQRHSATGRSLRNSHDITIPHARTKRLQQSFLHCAIRLYNDSLQKSA
ncbi:PREDICTED: uncharacterized protein LOC109470861 [Branchiostoma belcheri]|uniref:Uncharacterized protein LOC109470861 n=1 Tax=Branchiostoma belcheri TaxID=7741 RepID=A0A6P4YUP5_BRABE|nr:PREDICTED: uncharacterized protein LOC109470861 [Branchiostoma belcheri]